MNYCDLQRISDELIKCAKCGRAVKLNIRNAHIEVKAPCRVQSFAGKEQVKTRRKTHCIHLGQHIDWVECETCQNKKTMLKIYECEIFERCVMGSRVKGLQGCTGCEKYEGITREIMDLRERGG